MPVPVAEGGEAHGGRHKCYGPGEGGGAAQKKGKHTGHTHGEKLTRGMVAHKNTEIKLLLNLLRASVAGKRTFKHCGLRGRKFIMRRNTEHLYR